MRMDEYEDKLIDVMSYVRLRLNESGRRLKVRDTEDLRVAIEALDRKRRDQGSAPKFTDSFIDRILDTSAAQRLVGRVIGNRGPVGEIRTERRRQRGSGGEGARVVVDAKVQERRDRERSKGRDVYRSGAGGYAVKVAFGKRVFFRDLKSGRFISGKGLREE